MLSLYEVTDLVIKLCGIIVFSLSISGLWILLWQILNLFAKVLKTYLLSRNAMSYLVIFIV